jgi:hypothetical protein
MDELGTGERSSDQRIREAMEIPGVTHFVVACPKDVNMYEAAVRATGYSDRLKVIEVTEMLAVAMCEGPERGGEAEPALQQATTGGSDDDGERV